MLEYVGAFLAAVTADHFVDHFKHSFSYLTLRLPPVTRRIFSPLFHRGAVTLVSLTGLPRDPARRKSKLCAEFLKRKRMLYVVSLVSWIVAKQFWWILIEVSGRSTEAWKAMFG